MRISGPETKKCPAEFQDRLTRMFGRNQFGDPNFKIVWGQSEFFRMGNVWRDVHGNERHGYRERYLCHGMPCWVILRWKQPKQYGSPRMFYAETFDQVSGMYILGEYPWHGRYEIVQALHRKEFIDGKLIFTHFPLSHVLIDKVIPLMLRVQSMSAVERQAASQLAREREEKERTQDIADRLMEALPAYYGPVSFSRQGIRTALIDRKMEAIQKTWDRMSRNGKKPVFQKGIQQAPAPLRVN
jgi:hypothetical protein